MPGRALRAAKPRDSLADQATEVLRRAILDLRIEPNQRLEERWVEEQLKMSRTPAREAMNRLLAEGFLEFRQGQGVFVRAMGLHEISEFFEAYYAEEKMVAFFCKLTDPTLANDLQRLEETHSLAQQRMDVSDIQATNSAFHIRLAQACSNFHILRFARQIQDHAQRLTSYIYRREISLGTNVAQEQAKVCHFHLAIIDSVQSRDSRMLLDNMTAHARQFHERVSRVLTDDRGALFDLQVAEATSESRTV